MINVSSLNDARTAFTNSGLVEMFDLGEDAGATIEKLGRHVRANASADVIDADEFNALVEAFFAA